METTERYADNFSQGNFALSPYGLSLKWILFCWGTEELKGINALVVFFPFFPLGEGGVVRGQEV